MGGIVLRFINIDKIKNVCYNTYVDVLGQFPMTRTLLVRFPARSVLF